MQRVSGSTRRTPIRGWLCIAAGLLALQGARLAHGAQHSGDSDPQRVGFGLAFSAKALCSCVFVSARDAEACIEQDLTTDDVFDWWDDVGVKIDREARRVTLSRPGFAPRTAVYNGDQGCTTLPEGAERVFFEPLALPRGTQEDREQPWPDGGSLPETPLPPYVDTDELAAALDYAFDLMGGPPQRTRALVIVHRGRLIAERYAEGFDRSSRLVGWSMGKSLVGAMAGALIQEGKLTLHDPAPVAVWRLEGDPRGAITLRHLLRMSSGLDFQRDSPRNKTTANDHFYIYYGAIDVAAHSIARPLAEAPGRRWAYRNGDPLVVARIIRERLESEERNHFVWSQEALFNRIGARDFVLEPDAWGNFIVTGFDYGTARDWARFGLLHLQDGTWNGERILPEGWVDFVRTPAPADSSRSYGGLFWLNGGGLLPNVPGDAFMALGHAGQVTIIVPSADLVVARLGHSPDSSVFRPWFDQLMARLLVAVGAASLHPVEAGSTVDP